MTFLFYILFLLFGLVQEIHSFTHPRDVLDERKKFKEYNKLKKENPDTKLPDGVFGPLIYMLLTFIGLFTSQWLLFLVLFLIAFIPKRWVAWVFVDGVVSTILILAIVINKFHIHYDLTEYLLSHFN